MDGEHDKVYDCCVVAIRETMESRVSAVHQSSSEHDSVGSRDTGIDLNPDDVPVGYYPSVDRLSAHRLRSRSVAPSRSTAADNVPRVIDADDETDDPSVVGKDAAAASSRRSTSRAAAFDKTMEWLMTRTGSKCPPDHLSTSHYASLSHSSSHLCDAQGFDDAVATMDTNVTGDEAVLPEDPLCRPDGPSRLSSPSRSVCQPHSDCAVDEDEHQLAVSSDNLNVGVRRRVVEGSAAGAERAVDSDVADYQLHHQVHGSRQSLMSFVDSEAGARNRRRSKQKVSSHTFALFFYCCLFFNFVLLILQCCFIT